MRSLLGCPVRVRPTARLRLAGAVALLVAGLPAGAVAQDQTRGLKKPAPDAQAEQLYTGSHALLIGVSRYDNPAAWPAVAFPLNNNGLKPGVTPVIGFERAF